MKIIKLYEAFWNKKKEESNNDFDFDFLSNIGKMKQAILKIVRLHEEKCYNDNKLSSYDRFKTSLNDLIDAAIKGEFTITEDYLSVINLFEKEIYRENKLAEFDQSLFSSLDDLVGLFNLTLDEKAEDDINRLGKDAEHILNKMDKSWIYENETDGSFDTSDIDDVISGLDDIEEDENDIGMWTSEEDFEKDIESYIGKKMDNFDYSDKLQAYQYIENKTWVQNILEDGSEKDKDFINNFLSKMKDIFGL
jgi:hypothetical protein